MSATNNGENSPLPVVVSYKRKYLHEGLVNCIVKVAQEKSGAIRPL